MQQKREKTGSSHLHNTLSKQRIVILQEEVVVYEEAKKETTK
jgi:hypothetical protein